MTQENFLLHEVYNDGTRTSLTAGPVHVSVDGKHSTDYMLRLAHAELNKLEAVTERAQLESVKPAEKVFVPQPVVDRVILDRPSTSGERMRRATYIPPPAAGFDEFAKYAAKTEALVEGLKAREGAHTDRLGKAPEAKAEGAKHDAGKPLAGILYEDFPHALRAVIDVATFGANKYTRSSWKSVPNAEQRYADAMHRHLLAAASGIERDEESGLSHLAHACWGALALLEMAITQGQGIEAPPVSSDGKEAS